VSKGLLPAIARIAVIKARATRSSPRSRSNTRSQSVVLRKVTDALHSDLKSLEFEHKPQGLLGIGLSLKVQRSAPQPIRYYREKELETAINRPLAATVACRLSAVEMGEQSHFADLAHRESHAEGCLQGGYEVMP